MLDVGFFSFRFSFLAFYDRSHFKLGGVVAVQLLLQPGGSAASAPRCQLAQRWLPALRLCLCHRWALLHSRGFNSLWWATLCCFLSF